MLAATTTWSISGAATFASRMAGNTASPVAGVALLITFGRQGLIGGWLAGLGIQVAFTQIAVIMAQIFVSAPFYVKAASIGFAAVDA